MAASLGLESCCQCQDRTWATEAEESTLLEAVAWERLVKTLHAGEDMSV
jgi:hypothetical protein